MSFNSEKLLDETSWRILEALQNDARLSFSELGRIVGLSAPAATERVRRLESSGMITGYRAEVNAQKVGLPLTAFMQLATSPEKYPQIIKRIEELPEVLECHHVTGNYSFIIKVVASSIPHLEDLISQLSHYGQTSTSIVLSSQVKAKAINVGRRVSDL